MGDNPTARLFAELIHALHDESDALVANDAARLDRCRQSQRTPTATAGSAGQRAARDAAYRLR